MNNLKNSALWKVPNTWLSRVSLPGPDPWRLTRSGSKAWVWVHVKSLGLVLGWFHVHVDLLGPIHRPGSGSRPRHSGKPEHANTGWNLEPLRTFKWVFTFCSQKSFFTPWFPGLMAVCVSLWVVFLLQLLLAWQQLSLLTFALDPRYFSVLGRYPKICENSPGFQADSQFEYIRVSCWVIPFMKPWVLSKVRTGHLKLWYNIYINILLNPWQGSKIF